MAPTPMSPWLKGAGLCGPAPNQMALSSTALVPDHRRTIIPCLNGVAAVPPVRRPTPWVFPNSTTIFGLIRRHGQGRLAITTGQTFQDDRTWQLPRKATSITQYTPHMCATSPYRPPPTVSGGIIDFWQDISGSSQKLMSRRCRSRKRKRSVKVYRLRQTAAEALPDL
jgi:hypothetical protein